MDYLQPDFYRFNEDSIQLADYVAKLAGRTSARVLDLCSGCGVVGIEFSNKWPGDLIELHFCEYQKEFSRYIEHNLQFFMERDIPCEIHDISFGEFCRKNLKYDLILCNPPYFSVEGNRLSPDQRRNRCRFFMDDGPDELLLSVKNLLAKEGEAYLLFRLADSAVKKWYESSLQRFVGDLLMEKVSHVSGATIIRVRSF